MYTDNLTLPQMPTGAVDWPAIINEIVAKLDKTAGRLVHDLAADADYTLNEAASEHLHKVIQITDTGVVLTAGRAIVFPAKQRVFFFENATAQTLTVKVSGQAGVAITTGQKGWLACDGADVAKLVSDW